MKGPDHIRGLILPSDATRLQLALPRLILPLCLLGAAWAGVGGSISGTIKDSSGAAIAKASVTLVNANTGAKESTTADARGTFTFPVLPVGSYVLQVDQPGFQPYRRTGVVLDANGALLLDVVLHVGNRTDAITITDASVHVETSSSQMGEVITSEQMSAVPLNGRSYTDLLSLQPGVAPETSITSNTVQDVGAGPLSPSADLNPGTISIHGQREFANAFIVNGSDSEEDVNMGTAIIPNLDSIAEFRILTSNFDAEYGEFSGGQINVITKSGSDTFHGDVFEFLRNTDLDARNYFSPTRGAFIQNQFGGTLGGPIRRNKLFFFADYQGTRQRQGVDTGLIPVPSLQDRSGNLSDLANSFYTTQILNGQPVVTPTTVSGPAWAATLSQNFPYQVYPGEPYYFPGCTNPNYSTTPSTACVLPSLQIPAKAWSAPAQHLLQYIPAPSASVDQFSTSAYKQALRDDKGAIRLDVHTSWGLISGYYFLDDYSLDNPYPLAQGGASVPGFDALNLGRAQLFSLSDTKTLSTTAVNELHFSYMRAFNDLGKPRGGIGVSLVSQGFATPSGASIIVALDPRNEGVENLVFNNFSTGTDTNELKQANNTFQWLDDFSKVIGVHTIKAGGEFHFDEVNVNPIAQFNGSFLFTGSETGLDFADFLLGIPSQFNQSQLNPFYGRNKYAGIFAQDSWRVKSNLTLNYGLRWELNTPLTDISGHVESFRPGQNSTVYPCGLSPLSQQYFGVNTSDCNAVGVTATGLVVPGDKGVPAGLTSTYYKAFAPRVGIAWSPGNSDKTSIRAGWGLFYNPIEELVMAQFGAQPPFGGSSYLYDTFFNTPFVYQAGGSVAPNPFSGILTPTPGHSVDYSLFRPLLLYGDLEPHLRTQYTAQYNLTVQRQLTSDMMLQVGYVGSQGHHLLASHDVNYSNPQTCLDMYNISQYWATQGNQALSGAYACGPTVQDSLWSLPANSIPAGYSLHLPYGPTAVVSGPNNPAITLVGLRPYSSPNCNPLTGGGCPADGIPVFSSIFSEDTIANSSYNALEAMLEKRFSHGLQFQASYTFSKSIDEGSTFEETLDPFNYKRSRGLSIFNSKQRFVISYDWELPIPKHQGFMGRLVNDWAVSGITQFQSGFPIRLDTDDDYELIASLYFLGTEAPQRVAPFQILNPKKTGGFWFNPNDFQDPQLGQFNIGTQRTICCGPGLEEWDFAVHKKMSLSESKYFEFRGEIFNVFNHTNFYNPDGHFSDGPTAFGRITQAQDPRLVQFALKFYF